MLTPIGWALVALAVLFVVAVLCIAGALLYRRSHRQDNILVSPLVRKQLNADLDAAMTARELARVKREWMDADGWEVEDE